jgi:hypothetical protein
MAFLVSWEPGKSNQLPVQGHHHGARSDTVVVKFGEMLRDMCGMKRLPRASFSKSPGDLDIIEKRMMIAIRMLRDSQKPLL